MWASTIYYILCKIIYFSDSETKYAVNYYVAQIIQHPAYTSSPTINNDISLLRTTQAIEWSRGVGPMCLPPPGTT